MSRPTWACSPVAGSLWVLFIKGASELVRPVLERRTTEAEGAPGTARRPLHGQETEVLVGMSGKAPGAPGLWALPGNGFSGRGTGTAKALQMAVPTIGPGF